MVFQEPRLLPWRSARENVELALPPTEKPSQSGQAWLEKVGLADAGALYPRQMSGGMKQRVAIARALVVEPDLLLVDEPFASLDPQLSTHLMSDLTALIQERNLTCLWVTHDYRELRQVASSHLHLQGPPGHWSVTTQKGTP